MPPFLIKRLNIFTLLVWVKRQKWVLYGHLQFAMLIAFFYTKPVNDYDHLTMIKVDKRSFSRH